MRYEELYHIFRAYDIRGIFNRDLTVDVVARIGMAVATYSHTPYAVGGDTRGSTPAIKHALISGMLAAGVDVYDIGITPIGVAMYANVHKGLGMAYVTASHLPPEWNGIKLCRPNGDPMVGDDIYRIRDIFMDKYGEIVKADYKGTGKYMKYDLMEEYAGFIKELAEGTGVKVVVDCCNGATSLLVPRLYRDIGHKVIGINCDVDPRFPARGSEPEPELLGKLSREVVENKFQAGVAFDGDGDRTLFVDEKGRILSAEQAAIVMLEGMGRGDVVANVECSMIIDEYVKEYGGRIYRVPVGRTYMIREMIRRNAKLGVESSGHYVVKGNANMDDGILTSIHYLDAVANLGGEVADIVPPKYPFKKIKLPVDDAIKFKVVDSLKERYINEYSSVETIDGVRVNLDNGWVLIRPSNTEPLIRITVEATSERILNKLLASFRREVEEEARKLKV